MIPVLLEECDNCGVLEERVLVDSWTGKKFCLQCLSNIVNHLTNSPAYEGDNLSKLLDEEEDR